MKLEKRVVVKPPYAAALGAENCESHLKVLEVERVEGAQKGDRLQVWRIQDVRRVFGGGS